MFSKQQQSLMREPMQSNEFASQSTYCIFTSVFYFRTTLIKILVLSFVSLIILGAFKQFSLLSILSGKLFSLFLSEAEDGMQLC